MTDQAGRPPKRTLSPKLAALLAPPEIPPREPGHIGQGRDTAAHEVVRRLARVAGKAVVKGKPKGRASRTLGCLGVGMVALGGDVGDTPMVPGVVIPCAKASLVAQHLATAFQEAPTFLGREEDGAGSIFLTVNPITGTWTLLAADTATGVACPIMSGISAQLVGPATSAWRIQRGLEP